MAPSNEKENNPHKKKASGKKGKKRGGKVDDDVDAIINQFSMEEEQHGSGEVNSQGEASEVYPSKKLSSYFTPEEGSGSSTPKIQDDVDELIKQHLMEEEVDDPDEDQLVKSNFNDVDEIIKQHLMEEEKVGRKSPVKRAIIVKQKVKAKRQKSNADLEDLSP